jgi:hypothetical protein
MRLTGVVSRSEDGFLRTCLKPSQFMFPEHVTAITCSTAIFHLQQGWSAGHSKITLRPYWVLRRHARE